MAGAGECWHCEFRLEDLVTFGRPGVVLWLVVYPISSREFIAE